MLLSFKGMGDYEYDHHGYTSVDVWLMLYKGGDVCTNIGG